MDRILVIMTLLTVVDIFSSQPYPKDYMPSSRVTVSTKRNTPNRQDSRVTYIPDEPDPSKSVYLTLPTLSRQLTIPLTPPRLDRQLSSVGLGGRQDLRDVDMYDNDSQNIDIGKYRKKKEKPSRVCTAPAFSLSSILCLFCCCCRHKK